MTALAAEEFVNFGTSHLLALAVFVAGIWPVIRIGRSHRGTPAAVRFSRVFAVAIPCFTIPLQVVDFLPGNFHFSASLPLQLCDLAWVAATVALWTHHRFFVALTYFWGLVLTTQALITPTLNADFPDPKYLAFWAMHSLVVWSAIYLVWGLGLHPDWRDYAGTVATTAVWAVAVFIFNAITGTNYGFINRKPDTATILDLLGPWPMYVLVEILLIAAVWALMTWPWVRRDARKPDRS